MVDNLLPGSLKNRQHAARPMLAEPRLLPGAVIISLVATALVPDSGVGTNLILAILLLVSAACALPLLRIGGQVRIGAPVLLTATMYAAMLLGAWSTGTMSNIIRAALTGLATLFFVTCVTHLTPASRLKVDFWIISLAASQAVLAVLQKITGWPVLWGYLGTAVNATHSTNLIWTPGGRSMGTLSHPIPLAFLIGTAIILAITSSAIRSVLLRVLIIGVLFAGVLATGTRSAVVLATIFAGVAVFSVIRGRHRVLIRSALIVALLLFLVQVDVLKLTVFTSLEGTQSLLHRGTAAETAANLLSAGDVNVWIGYGRSAIEELAAHGIIVSTVVLAIDNNFVTILATAGIVGLTALIGLVLHGLFRGSRVSRIPLLFCVSMFFSFDVTLWLPSSLLFFYFTASREGAMPEQGPTPVQTV